MMVQKQISSKLKDAPQWRCNEGWKAISANPDNGPGWKEPLVVFLKDVQISDYCQNISVKQQCYSVVDLVQVEHRPGVMLGPIQQYKQEWIPITGSYMIIKI